MIRRTNPGTLAQAHLQRIRLQRLDARLRDRAPTLPLRADSRGSPCAWFLGPRAENEQILLDLVTQAVRQHAAFRRSFHPNDPAFISEAVQNSPRYRDAVDDLNRHAHDLFELMKQSVPFFSMRYQGHMLWDQALPAVIGYIGAMLYNQNNVAAEASPVTTQLEIEVGKDLCRMLGFAIPDPATSMADAIVPWGHITCDGSVANIEAMWAARNAKFYPIALRAALRQAPELAAARSLEVALLGGERARLADLDTWTLLNLPLDEVVRMPHAIQREFGVDTSIVADALDAYSLQNLGWIDFYQRFMTDVPAAPAVMVPSTRHYSWPKAAALLGLGQNNLLGVHVDLNARMDMHHLADLLDLHHRKRIPVTAVVAVIGSTEESAVDPLTDILTLREQFRRKGLDFAIHCDAAWGGYFNTMLIDGESGDNDDGDDEIPIAAMSDYVRRQYQALRRADSITVDPHKGGYVPYPAGALCYRNSAMRDLVSLAAPVVFHGQSEPTVGIYGIEGSKPGAAAAAIYLAHKVIRPNRSGYGRLLGQCMWTSKRLYSRLLALTDDRFTVTLFPMLPAERDGAGEAAVAAQKTLIRDRFVRGGNRELRSLLDSDAEARRLFNEMGSDQVILAFSLNFVGDRGPNRDIQKANAFNQKVFELCSLIDQHGNLNRRDLFLTSSRFDPAAYGQAFVDAYCKRLGVEPQAGVAVDFLISTAMDPWTTELPDGSDFLETVEKALRAAAHQALDELGFGADANDHDALSPGERNMLKTELQPGIEEGSRHAFIMVGDQTLFLCHMPMFHMEDHCYQLIVRASLPPAVMRTLREERLRDPHAAFFLANLERDPMSMAQVQSGRRRSFSAVVYKGIPPAPNGGYTSWPWPESLAIVKETLVTVEHIVHARHFDFNFDYPHHLTYILFGAGDEAHMQSYQTKEPDFDHVLSLAEAPAWLPEIKLAAGVQVGFPELPSRPVRTSNPLTEPSYRVRYQGFDRYLGFTFAETYELKIGKTWWFSTSPLNLRPPEGEDPARA